MVPGLMRQAAPTRGAMLLVSAFSNPDGNVPLKGPVSPGSTGTAALKSGGTSRLTMLPLRSTKGQINS